MTAYSVGPSCRADEGRVRDLGIRVRARRDAARRRLTGRRPCPADPNPAGRRRRRRRRLAESTQQEAPIYDHAVDARTAVARSSVAWAATPTPSRAYPAGISVLAVRSGEWSTR